MSRTGRAIGRSAVAVLGATLLGITAAPAAASVATVSGTVVVAKTFDVTIQTPGRQAGPIARMVAYATKLGAKDEAYVYGGGHAHAGVPTKGGFDCSGAVAAVLSAGGLWPHNQSVPGDAGIAPLLRAQHLIADGPGQGPTDVTFYDYPGRTIEMSIDGRFYGTGNDSRGGPGWFDSGLVNPKGVKVFHIVPSALHLSPADAHDVTFQYRLIRSQYKVMQSVRLGSKVTVTYRPGTLASMTLLSIKNTGGKPFRSV